MLPTLAAVKVSPQTDCLYILGEDKTSPTLNRRFTSFNQLPKKPRSKTFIPPRPPPTPASSSLLLLHIEAHNRMAMHALRTTLGAILAGSGFAAMFVINIPFHPDVVAGLMPKDGRT